MAEIYCRMGLTFYRMEENNMATDVQGRGNNGRTEKYAGQMKSENEFAVVSELFGVMADSSRLRIFWLLCHCEKCVTDISDVTGMSPPAVSHHLRKLKEAELVDTRRDGKEVYYRVDGGERARLLHEVVEKTAKIVCPSSEDGASAFCFIDNPDVNGAHGYPKEQIDTVRALHDELRGDLSKRVTVEDMAKKYHINSFTLKKVFRAVYGNSIAAHIREHRMEAAAEMIRETGDSIGDVARSVGYENAGKFAAEFRKYYGVLPTEYKKGL